MSCEACFTGIKRIFEAAAGGLCRALLQWMWRASRQAVSVLLSAPRKGPGSAPRGKRRGAGEHKRGGGSGGIDHDRAFGGPCSPWKAGCSGPHCRRNRIPLKGSPPTVSKSSVLFPTQKSNAVASAESESVNSTRLPVIS